MKTSSWFIRSLMIFQFAFLVFNLQAQVEEPEFVFEPSLGQAGKDVIWVPTPDKLVDKMLEIAKVTADDFVIDLGSGDGRTVIAAAKLGARALGIEYNPDMIRLSLKNAENAGVKGKTDFIETDLFKYDLSEATVITMFLLTDINLSLRPKILDLKPGTRIVSNTFDMGAWKPDLKATIDNYSETYDDEMYEEDWNSWTKALLWIVPAKVEGRWKFGEGELSINQEFQMFYGTYRIGPKTKLIENGKLDGSSISFSIDGNKYSGHVNGDKTMEGTVNTGSSRKKWIATYSGK